MRKLVLFLVLLVPGIAWAQTLSLTQGGSGNTATVTVTSSGQFKLVWESANNWGLDGWYDLVNDPGATLNLAAPVYSVGGTGAPCEEESGLVQTVYYIENDEKIAYRDVSPNGNIGGTACQYPNSVRTMTITENGPNRVVLTITAPPVVNNTGPSTNFTETQVLYIYPNGQIYVHKSIHVVNATNMGSSNMYWVFGLPDRTQTGTGFPDTKGWIRAGASHNPETGGTTESYLFAYQGTPSPYAVTSKANIMMVPSPTMATRLTTNIDGNSTLVQHEWACGTNCGTVRWGYNWFQGAGAPNLAAGGTWVEDFLLQLGTQGSSVLPNLTTTAVAGPIATAYLASPTPPPPSGGNPSDPLNPSFLPSSACTQVTGIWVTDTMQKVRQDTGTGTGCSLTIYATQNEIADFQVHFHDGGSGTANLNFTVSNFTQTAPASLTIGGVATDIISYREAYMNVTGKVTATANTFYNAQGFYPDALIPAVDPYHGQTTNAWPFTVAAGKNQSAWIDVHVPKTAPSGYYSGTVTVKSGATTLATIPVILGVWQWPNAGFMPSTATLNYVLGISDVSPCVQLYGSTGGCSAYPGSGGSSDNATALIKVDVTKLFLDHRLNTVPGYPYPTTTFTQFTSFFGPIMAGTANTVIPGAKPTFASMLFQRNPPSTNAQLWATQWSSSNWGSLYVLSSDEPGASCGAWPTAGTAAPFHATTPPMPLLVTAQISDATTCNTLNVVDILVPIINQMDPQGGSLQRPNYNTWLAGTASPGPPRQVFSYQSCSSGGTCSNGTTGGSTATWPNYGIDGKPAANRAMEWMTYRNQESGELYYSSACSWEVNSCFGGLGSPWTNQLAFGNWGDGTLLYPSTSNGTNFVTQSGGAALTTPIILSSIRLNHIRDGMQDYEYMTKLAAAGQSSFVTTQLNSWVTNSYTFETSGTGLQAARSNIGNALHDLTFPPSGTFPWSSLCAASRCMDWSNAGVLDPVSGLSEAKGGGIPNYTVQSGTTIAAYGQPNNSGRATSNVATMTVTLPVTTGTSPQSNWTTAGANSVSLLQPSMSGTYAGQTAPFVFTRTSGDALNCTTDWVGKNFSLLGSGNTWTAAIASVTCPNTITFATQPHSPPGTSFIPNGSYTTGTVGGGSGTITSVVAGVSFTLTSTPTTTVGGYQFAAAGDPGAINTALQACGGTPGNGRVVLLGPGTFNLLTSPTMVGVHDCVLRGNGADLTTINYVVAGNACGGFPAGICFGDTTTVSGAGSYPASLTAGMLPGGINDATWTGASTTSTVTPGTYTPGSTWITLTNVGSAGGGIHNGQVLNLDQEDAALTSSASGGYDWCTRLGNGNYPPTSCDQENPFGGRGGRISGTATLAGNTFTVATGSNFVTGGAWTNASIIINNGGFTIGSVIDSTHLTLLARSTGAGAVSGACSPVGTTYLDTNPSGLYYACGTTNVWAATSAGVKPWSVNYRGQSQVVTVVSGCTSACTGAGSFTVQISDPLIGQNWATAQVPAAWFPTGHPATASTTNTGVNAGVEDLTIDQAFNTFNSTATSIGFVSVNNAWAKGIRSLHGDRSHVAALYADHISVVNSYFYGTKASATQSYAIEADSTSSVLFENNICQQIVSCMTPDGSSGNVYAYNFNIDAYVANFGTLAITSASLSGSTATFTYTGSSIASGVNFLPASVAGSTNDAVFGITNVKYPTATGTTFTIPAANLPCAPTCPASASATGGVLHVNNSIMSGMYTAHSDGNRYALFEGNIGSQFHPDTVHGPARTHTVYRNYLGGNEKNLSGDLWPVRIEPLNRYLNFLGNVLGTTAIQTTYTNIYAFNGAATEGPNTIDADSFTSSTSYRWGNYDVVNLNTMFTTSEVPITDAFGYAQTVPSCNTVASCNFPKSFYLSSTTPAWFNTRYGTVPYPVIGPDVVGGTAMSSDMNYTRTPPGGHAWDNAASKVWQNAPIDPAYVGFDGGVRLFNELMYQPSSGAAATLSPNPLSFGNQNVGTTSAVSFAVFANTGTVNVTISGITVAGHFTQSGGSCTVPITIAPGNNCNIGITFSPNTTGPFTGTVSVTSNAVPSPTVANLTGTGTQATITWSSPQGGAAYNFGNVLIGQSINSANLTLTNSGTGPLTVTPTISGANAAQFAIISNTCPGSLGAGLSCTFVVRFTPAAATTYTANLVETDPLASNSPQNLVLSGSGQIAVPNLVAPVPWILM